MKKILTVVLLWTALYGTAFSQNASDFTVNDKGVITKYTGFDTVVVIPAVIGGKNITGIGKEAFLRADLTKVTIPEGVTWIGESAFSGNKLTSVTIPGSVKIIDDFAFNGNTALAKIIIPEGVIYIGIEAFASTKCTSVSLPSTITLILPNAFDLSAKPSFTLAANIPATFDKIPAFYSYIANDRKAGTYAFNLPLVEKKTDDYRYYETRYGAVLLSYLGDSTRVRIPATIGGVAVKALYGRVYNDNSINGTFENRKIAAVQIPERITYIGESAFSENDLVNVTIPNSVTVIGNNAFRDCKSLTSVTIPDGVTSIRDSSFLGCISLTSVTIPDNVTSIRYGAFDCTSLTSVTFQGTITSENFDEYAFYRRGYILTDLREKYLAGGVGTYTRPNSDSRTWTKQ